MLRLLRLVAAATLSLTILAGALLPAFAGDAPAAFNLDNSQVLSAGSDSPQAAGLQSNGFSVRDGALDSAGQQMLFWSKFQSLGGVDALGYPISRVYRETDGFYYQLFQMALLQWRPEQNTAVAANVLDELSNAGADGFLAGKGIPTPVADDGSRGDFKAATQIRLGWLTQPEIKAYYMAASPSGDLSAAIHRFGLPASPPVRSGPFIVQRFQRTALQYWLDSVPGMPAPGSVVPALVGELYRQYQQAQGIGTIDGRFRPEGATVEDIVAGLKTTAPAANAAQVATGLEQPLALLEGTPAGRALAATIRAEGALLTFEDVQAIAQFRPRRLTISIDPDYARADPKALAAVLAHEGSHLWDYVHAVDMTSADGCYATELKAFQTQATVWAALYGPTGKPGATSALDEQLNMILARETNDPGGFGAEIKELYRDQCE